jgi:nucleotide-binding universal stress UspA family protein
MTNRGDLKATRIVVGYDGSPDSVHALEWAAREAETNGAHLELIATWQWPSGLGWSVIPNGYNPADDVATTLDAAVENFHVSHPNVTVSVRIIEGSAATTLVDASRRADLVVVGTRGHGELAGLLIGSVSQYCAAHALCPVVVIRTAK